MQRLLCLALIVALVIGPAYGQTGATGTITAQNGAVSTGNMMDWASAWVQITGTWTATLQFEGTVDNTNYFSVNAIVPTSGAVVTSTTANGNWQLNVAGLANFRVRASAYTSGTATVTLRVGGAVGTLSAQSTAAGTVSSNVTQFGGTNVSTGTGAGGAGIPRVTISNDSSLAANQSVNTAQINGVAPTMGNGVSGTGVQRVTIASDSTGQVALAAGAATIGALTANQSVNAAQIAGTATVTAGVSGLLAVGGGAASGAAKSGNPVQIGGVFNTTPPSAATGQVVETQATSSGFAITVVSAGVYNKDFLGGITTLASGSTSTITATTTLVQGMYCNNATGSAVNVHITDGNNVYYVGPNYSLPANSNVRFIADTTGYVFASGVRASAGTASAVNCQVSGKQ